MGPSSPSSKRHSPQFSVHVCCGQTTGWIKMPLGREVGLCPGYIVLDGDLPPPKGHSPEFSVHVYCGQTVADRSQLLLNTCCTAYGRVSLYFTTGRPFPPKLPLYTGASEPLSNTWFLRHTRVHIANSISIGLAAFAGLTIV